MTAHEKQLQYDFEMKNLLWAEKWLAVPESELPGTLTHDKLYQVLEKAEDALLDLKLSGYFYADGRFAGFGDDE